jgi:hypothetical protein
MLEAFRGAVLLGIGGTILFSLYYLITVAANLNNDNSTSAFPMVIILSFIGFATIGLGLALILQAGKTNKTSA